MIHENENIHNKDVEDILLSAYTDSRVYAKTFYPNIFYRDFSTIHDKIFAAIDAKNDDGTPKYNQIAIQAPRGIGKSAIAKTIGRKKIRYKECNFIVYVGKNEDFAVMQTENMKNAMLQNTLENKIFGPINAKSELDLAFSKKSWVTTNGVYVLPRGAQQPVRGITFDYQDFSLRPDLFIVDDLEDVKNILSDLNRVRNKEWFLGDVVEAKPQDHKNWQIIYIDTLKHEDSLLKHLLNREDWFSLNLPLCDDHYNSLAPEFISTEDILKEVESHRKAGTLDVFAREKMGLATSKEDATFRSEYFQYYNETDTDFVIASGKRNFVSVVIGDPAKSPKFHNADSALVVWGIDMDTGRMYFRDEVSGKLHPDEFINNAFMLATRYNAIVVAFEETGLNEFIRQPVHNKAVELGFPLAQVQWLQARKGANYGFAEMGGKAARVAQLVSYYRTGRIWHNRTVSNKLETQLLQFPRPALWDVCDAAAYVIEVMEDNLAYFEPVFDDDPDVIEAEYMGLDDEDIDDFQYSRVTY